MDSFGSYPKDIVPQLKASIKYFRFHFVYKIKESMIFFAYFLGSYPIEFRKKKTILNTGLPSKN